MKILKKIIIAIFIVPIFSLTVLGDEILDLYKYLHENPELSWQEHNTSRLLASKLRDIGFEVTENVPKTAVVAVYKNGSGSTLLLRADMDALPVEEKTNLSYASKVRVTNIDGMEVPVILDRESLSAPS